MAEGRSKTTDAEPPAPRYARAAARGAARLTGRLDLEDVLSAITSALVDDFDAAAARVWLADGAGAPLRLEASAGIGEPDGAMPPAIAHVAESRAAIFCEDVAADGRVDAPWLRGAGMRAAALVPLIAGGELAGVIAAYFRAPVHADVFEILGTFAATAAAALNDVKLFARQQVARAEAELARAQAEASERRYRTLAEAIPQLVWTADAGGSCDYFNERWSEYTGLPVEELLGWSWEKVVHPDHIDALHGRVRSAVAVGESYEIEFLLRRWDDSYRWFLARAIPVHDREGRVTRWLGTCTDIDDRKREEEAHRFLTDATALLVSSLDYRVTLESVARLAVPALADGCVMDVVEADGALYRVAAVDARPEMAANMDVLKNLPPPKPGDAVFKVLELTKAVIMPPLTPEEARKNARDEEHARVLVEVEMQSGIIAPLRARGRAIGIIWLYRTRGRHPYTPADLALAEDLAGRVALALDNARLFRDAQEAIRLRDEFLSIASHELKTPLTPLKLQLSRLRRGEVNEAVAAKLEVADRQIDRLTRLINQLLDVSRITSGRLSLFPEDVDLVKVAHVAAEELGPELRRSGSALRLEMPKELVGRWDALRVEQVVVNLLSNAIKYGDGQPIELSLAALEGRARIVVVDHGIGIAVEDQARIFGRFERAVSTRHYGGFGLGLWIVRQIVEASGGSIFVTSAPKQGSTFVVDLPI